MQNKIFLLPALFLTLFTACKTYQPDALPAEYLSFGNGGGFAGIETEYILLENGQLFVRKGVAGEWQALGKAGRARARALYRLARTKGLLDAGFQHPGNTYSFVQWHGPEPGKRLVWGDQQYQVDDKVRDLYRQLNALVKN